jgi:hypothetical protein
MRMWGSKVLATVNQGPGGIYFVTSEDNYNKTRREFSVRRYDPETGDVRTAFYGKPYESKRYSTPQQARSVATILAQFGEPTTAPVEPEGESYPLGHMQGRGAA